jgi:ATP-dependent Clp protease adaptor protein ClpS
MTTADTSTTTNTTVVIKTPSMWKVMLRNDDFTSMEFVVQVLVHIFNKSVDEATTTMLLIHNTGQANVGLFTKDVALTKVNQTKSAAERYGHPLMAEASEA